MGSIYYVLYRCDHGRLSRHLTRRQRTGRPLRQRRRSADQRHCRFITPAQLIDTAHPGG